MRGTGEVSYMILRDVKSWWHRKTLVKSLLFSSLTKSRNVCTGHTNSSIYHFVSFICPWILFLILMLQDDWRTWRRLFVLESGFGKGKSRSCLLSSKVFLEACSFLKKTKETWSFFEERIWRIKLLLVTPTTDSHRYNERLCHHNRICHCNLQIIISQLRLPSVCFISSLYLVTTQDLIIFMPSSRIRNLSFCGKMCHVSVQSQETLTCGKIIETTQEKVKAIYLISTSFRTTKFMQNWTRKRKEVNREEEHRWCVNNVAFEDDSFWSSTFLFSESHFLHIRFCKVLEGSSFLGLAASYHVPSSSEGIHRILFVCFFSSTSSFSCMILFVSLYKRVMHTIPPISR